MALQNLLLSSDLIFIALTFVTAVSYDDMPQFIKPNYYDINLTLYTEESHYMNSDLYKVHRWYIEEQHAKNNSIFYAEFYIIFQVTQEIQEIHLHANNLHICASSQLFDKETYNDEKLRQEIRWLRCLVYYDAQTVIFEFHNKIKPGSYILRIKYVGAITDYVGGIFRTSYIDENGDKTWLFAAGNFLPPEIRQVFPCWDKPSINILIQSISIRNHQNYTVLTGLPERMPPKQIENDMVQSHFISKGSMSIYRVTFVISQLSNAFSENETVNMWCRKLIVQHVKFAQNVAKNVTIYLKGYNSVINHVAIPGFRNEGTDSSGLILYSEAAITYDEKSDPLLHKIEVARLIAYKIIRYLLDSTRHMSSWSDLWIIEGIAIFCGANIIDEIIPNIPRIIDLFIVQAKYEALLWDAYNDMPLELQDDAISKMKPFWFYPRYLKASLLMRMLQYVMTDKVFYKGVQRLYTNIQLHIHYDDNNFWNDMQKVYCDNFRKLNLIEAFSGCTKQRYYPVLNVRRNYTTNDVMIELLQNNFNISYQNNCWIPVTYVTQSSPIFNHNLNIYWLKPERPYLRLNLFDDGWIIVNAQQTGYYRVNYDIKNWRKIINYMYNNDNYTNIHVLNRAQIVDDVYYFFSTNELDYSAFKLVTSYLSQEMDYVVWHPMFKNMERMSSFFAFRESTKLKEHLREVLNKLMLKITYEEDPDDSYHTKCLRQEAAKWACILGSVICKNMAMTKMNQHLTNREVHKLSSWWKEWAYCAGLTTVNSITWMEMMLTRINYLLRHDNKILEHLTCTTDLDNIKNYLRILIIIYYDTLIQNNQAKIFLSIVAKHVNNDKVLEFILSHFQQIKPSKISTIVALISIIDHVYDESQLQQIRESKFVRNNLSKLFPHVQRKIERRLIEINNQMNFWVKNYG